MTTATTTPDILETPADVRVEQVPLDQIDRSRNHRIAGPDDERRIAELVESMRAAGQLQTVRVYEAHEEQTKNGEPYLLGFGWRRCCALDRLGKTSVRAEIFPPASDAEIEAARAIENLHRQDIGPMEEVLAVSYLLDVVKNKTVMEQERIGALDNPHAYVASQLGQSERWVRDRDYLHRLHPAVQDLALRTELPAGHLREIAKVGDVELQLRIAIEAAGGSAYYIHFKESLNPEIGVLHPKGEYRNEVEEWLARTAEGSFHRQTLKEVQRKVGEAQRSLRTVPWEYHLPVLVTAGNELPACSGCQHNSETDRGLFGIEEDTANPRGICLNPSCFQLKTDAVESAKAKLRQSVTKRKTAPTAEQVDAKTPEWLKQSTARGFAQREWKKAQSQPASSKANGAADRFGSRKLTAHEQAVQKFRSALLKWEEAATVVVHDAARTNPPRWIGLCVLTHTAAFADQEQWDIPHVSTYNRVPETGEPEEPSLPSAQLQQALALFAGGTWPDLQKLAALDVSEMFDSAMAIDRYASPTVIHTLAQICGAKIDAPPTWDDFKPKSAADKAAEKLGAPAGKSLKKKRTTKKKSSRKGAA